LAFGTLENVFSWSKSRAEEFQECQRKYFYDRYASWGGWDKHAPREARLAYVLKNLKNRWAWKGETVHHTIEDVLKTLRVGKPVSPADAQESLTRIMRADFRSSKTKKYLDEPKKTVGLFEHEYEKPVSDAVWKTLHDEAAQAVANFFNSALFAELAADDKKNWLIIEDLEEFEFDGAKIYVKLDFARRKGDTIEIYDWKTGKDERAASVQIGAYALYAMKKWGVPLAKLRAFLVYLSSPTFVPQDQRLDEALILESERVMRESIRGMRSLLSDAGRNIPKGREFFRYTDNERLCGNCNFYKMCEKYLPLPGRQAGAELT
jgi:CRISPR/Cas system-associated exonuclease Cas4 (RecB family)